MRKRRSQLEQPSPKKAAEGMIEHFRRFVDGDPAQPSFSANFVLENDEHQERHRHFLEQLGNLGLVDIHHPPTVDVLQVMQLGEVSLYRQGLENFSYVDGIYVPAGIGIFQYFADRKDPTAYTELPTSSNPTV